MEADRLYGGDKKVQWSGFKTNELAKDAMDNLMSAIAMVQDRYVIPELP